MFEGNLMSFNPGWDQNAQKLNDFEDVREIQKSLKASDLSFISEADEATTGLASLMIADPDSNVILLDQHA